MSSRGTSVKYLFTAMIIAFSSYATAQDIEIVHCPNGCPAKASTDNTIVVREIFTLSNHKNRKFADWVAYRVTSETIATSADLNRTWKSDALLDPGATLEDDDYKCAARPSASCKDANGNSLSLGIDRGHQAPLAAFAGTVYWRDTNILSNITPQKKELNQGAWERLEHAVREAAHDLREVFVLTGPLYDPTENQMKLPRADESHNVPTGYWKVVYTGTGRATAFIFDQDVPRNFKYCDAIKTVADVESASGFDIWPKTSSWPTRSLDSELSC